MSRKTNRLVNQEGRECYGDKAAAGAASMSQNDDNFVNAAAELNAARTGKSAGRVRSQRVRGLTDHVTGAAAERDDEEKEESAAMERLQPARNLVGQASGEVNTIFGGGNGWGNDSAPPFPPPKYRVK